MSSTTITIEELILQIMSFVHDDLLLGALDSNPSFYPVYFDCTLWNCGYMINNPSDDECCEMIIPSIRSSILILLDKIMTTLNAQLLDYSNNNFAYKTQVDRLLHIVIDLKNNILAINFIDNCLDPNMNAILLSTLIDTCLQLIYILEVLNTLISYMNNCIPSGKKVFEIFMGRFINAITALITIMPDWQVIVITYLQSTTSNTQSYVASYAPRQPLTLPSNHIPQAPTFSPKTGLHQHPNNTYNY